MVESYGSMALQVSACAPAAKAITASIGNSKIAETLTSAFFKLSFLLDTTGEPPVMKLEAGTACSFQPFPVAGRSVAVAGRVIFLSLVGSPHWKYPASVKP